MLPDLDPPRAISVLALRAQQEKFPELELAFRSQEHKHLLEPKLVKVFIEVKHYNLKHTFIWVISTRVKTFLQTGHETTEGGMIEDDTAHDDLAVPFSRGKELRHHLAVPHDQGSFQHNPIFIADISNPIAIEIHLILIRYQRTIVTGIDDPVPVRIIHEVFDLADVGAAVAIHGVPIVACLVGIDYQITTARWAEAAVLWTARAALARVARAVSAGLDHTVRRAAVKVECVPIVALLARSHVEGVVTALSNGAVRVAGRGLATVVAVFARVGDPIAAVYERIAEVGLLVANRATGTGIARASASQNSSPLQKNPSAGQWTSLGVFTHSSTSSLQVSSVHPTPSLQSLGPPPRQDPSPSHASPTLQNSPSEQGLPDSSN
jgi:hypothetical protein